MDGLVMSLNSEDEEELTSQNHEVHVPSSGGDLVGKSKRVQVETKLLQFCCHCEFIQRKMLIMVYDFLSCVVTCYIQSHIALM